MTETQAKQIAFRELNRRWRVLAPEAEAVVTFPDFNPFCAVQPIAYVTWPATVAMQEVVLTHFIYEGQHCTEGHSRFSHENQ